jgi:predicted RNA-binding Zn-ribbon protein involved in translation (DUF1610 family)
VSILVAETIPVLRDKVTVLSTSVGYRIEQKEDKSSKACPRCGSVDEVLTDAVKRYVEDRSWTKLLDYGAERAKTLGIKESDIDRLIAESRAEQRGH